MIASKEDFAQARHEMLDWATRRGENRRCCCCELRRQHHRHNESRWRVAVGRITVVGKSTSHQFGIHFPKHRKRAIAIGDSLGICRDYPVSKGCTSPFAPIWINEMVRRQS